MLLKNILKSSKEKLSGQSVELLKNTVLFGIGSIGSKLILFLLVPLYSSYLATAEYGNADLITSSMSLFYPIFSLGIEQSVIRFGLTKVRDRNDVIRISISICTIGGLIFIACIFGANFFVHIPYIPFIILLYYGIAFSTVLESYAKVKEYNRLYAINSILKALVLCLANIVTLIYLRLGVFGYLLSAVLSNIFTVVFLGTSCSAFKDFRKGTNNRDLRKDMLKYCLPLVPNTISWWITQMSDRYLVKWISGDVINGLYTIAYKIPSVFNLIVSIFSQAFSLSVIKQIDLNTDNNFSRIYRYYIAISFISGSFIIEITRILSRLLLKNDFYDAWVYIPLLIFAYVIGNLQAFYGSLFTGLKKSKDALKTTLCGAVTNIALNLILIPKYEAYGAAIGTIVSYVIIYVSRMMIIRKCLAFDHQIIKISISIFIMGIQVCLYEQAGITYTVFSWIVFSSFILIYFREVKELFFKFLSKI